MLVLGVGLFMLNDCTCVFHSRPYHQNDRGEYSGCKEWTINMYMDMELIDPQRSSHPWDRGITFKSLLQETCLGIGS